MKRSEKNKQNEKVIPKVIHIEKTLKMEKMELYTKLFTLSTEKRIKKVVYIVKKRIHVLYRNNKVDKMCLKF